MKHSIEIAGTVYRSKSEVANKAEGILQRYPIGTHLNDEDKNFILALLSLRSEQTIREKTGPGISAITPMYPRQFDNCRCFCLTRTDGTWTDFSYRKSLENINNPGYARKAAKAAARYEVKPQIEDFRLRNFNGTCSVTGEGIDISSSHVDHIPPDTFDVLFAGFLKSENKNIKHVETVGVGDRQIGTLFCDRAFAERWKQYHKAHAKLRIVSAKANLTLIPKSRGDYDQ